MSDAYRDARMKAATSGIPLDVDTLLGPLLAVERPGSLGTVVFAIIFGLFFGVGSCVLGFVIAWDRPLIFLVLLEVLGLACLAGSIVMVVRAPRRIEVREKGLVYVWRWAHPQGHGTRIRFIPWSEVAIVGSTIARRVRTYWVKLHNGETFYLGYDDEEVVKLAREIMLLPVSHREEEIRKLIEIQKSAK